MPELRWALIGLGALFIVGLALWEWRRSQRRHVQPAADATPAGVPIHSGGEPWPQRIEPRIDSLSASQANAREMVDVLLEDVPVIHPADAGADLATIDLPVAAESAVDVPSAAASAQEAAPAPPFAPAPRAAPGARPPAGSGPAATPAPTPVTATDAGAAASGAAAPAIRWPPERADRVLTLRVVNTQGALLSGRAVRLALEQAGLVHGPQRIYHRVEEDGAVLVSVANMLRPGDLDPLHMDEQQFRGLSLFTVLPGALPASRMLDELVAVARAIAWRVNAVVQDDQGAELDGERLVALRQSLTDAAEEAGS